MAVSPPLSAGVSPPDAKLGFGTNELGTKKIGDLKAIEYDETKLWDARALPIRVGGKQSETTLTRTSIDRFFGVDAAASARGIWGSANANVAFHTSVSFDQSSFYYWARLEASTGFQNLGDSVQPTLTADALSILRRTHPNGVLDPEEDPANPGVRYDPNNILDFYAAYGTHFWGSVSYGVRYSILYVFSSQSEATRRDLSAGIDVELPSYDFRGNIRDTYRSKKDTSQVKVDIHFEGVPTDRDCAMERDGGGTPVLLDILDEDPEVVDRNMDLLIVCLGNNQVERLPLEFGAPTPYAGLAAVDRAIDRYRRAGQGLPDFGARHRQDNLAKLWNLYDYNREQIARRVKQIQLAAIEDPVYVYSAEKLQVLQDQIRRHEEQNNEITALGEQCVESEKHPERPYDPAECDASGIQELVFQMPEPDKDFSGLGEWTFHDPFVRDPTYPWERNPQHFGCCPSEAPAYLCSWGSYFLSVRSDIDRAIVRTFHTRDCFWSNRSGISGEVAVYLSGTCDKHIDRIGYRTLITDRRGDTRPDINPARCMLRILEGETAADGFPALELQLIFFDDLGYIQTDPEPLWCTGTKQRIFKFFSEAPEPRFFIDEPRELPDAVLNHAYGPLFLDTRPRSAGATWSLIGNGPPGIALDPVRGLLSGAPTSLGTYQFLLEVTDAAHPDPSRPLTQDVFTLSVVDSDFQILEQELPAGAVGACYLVGLAAVGGAPPYSWRLANGSMLPDGLTLNSCGVLSGVPTKALPQRTFTVEVVDVLEQVQARDFMLPISPGESTVDLVIADSNGDGVVDLSDAVYLLNFLFAGGSEPEHIGEKCIMTVPLDQH